jgi:tripartite-type tricarboxylate transporter receptor subunit TctC
MPLRTGTCLAARVLMGVSGTAASAAAWPTEPIRFVVSVSPGTPRW